MLRLLLSILIIVLIVSCILILFLKRIRKSLRRQGERIEQAFTDEWEEEIKVEIKDENGQWEEVTCVQQEQARENHKKKIGYLVLIFLGLCTVGGLINQYYKEIFALLISFSEWCVDTWNALTPFWHGFLHTAFVLIVFFICTIMAFYAGISGAVAVSMILFVIIILFR